MPSSPPARYTGLWLAQQAQQYEDADRFTVEPPPDPGHASTDEPPAQAQVMQQAPVFQGGGELVTDAIDEERTGRAPADRIDWTPTRGPQASASPPGGFYRPFDTPPVMATMRGMDQGAPRKDGSQFGRPYQFPSEQYFGLSIDGSGAPPITQGAGDDILRRGLNAYPENNGDGGRVRPAGPGRTPAGRAGRGSWRGSGWNLGRYAPLVTNVQRNFKVPNRTHRRFRVVHPDIAAYVGDSPPTTDRYSSGLSRLQRFGLNFARTRQPGMRRAPGPWDEAAIAGAPTVSGGTSVDGLVVP